VPESELIVGVLSRRLPISFSTDLIPKVEHVGGLTRVLPALAEFSRINWTALTSVSQIGLPTQYSFSNVSGENFQHDINIHLSEVSSDDLDLCDWFCANYLWPMLHDLPIPDLDAFDIDLQFESLNQMSRTMARNSFDPNNDGYLVNDFQLSLVTPALRELEPDKSIVVFLHTPWPKAIPKNHGAVKALEYIASGMLAANVIEFQTAKDLEAFKKFAFAHLPIQAAEVKFNINPVSVNVKDLLAQAKSSVSSTHLAEDDISFLHIARSDPIKNTLVAIKAFTLLAKQGMAFKQRFFLDLFVVPSRQRWPEYQLLLSEIIDCAVECNSQLNAFGYDPIRLHIGDDYQVASQALTRYDYLIVCSVADGLNLVVKEGAILNTRNGVVISSPNVGAMAELGQNCVVASGANEIDVFEAMLAATKLNDQSRKLMATNLKFQIQEFDASRWAQMVIANFKILEKV